MFNPILPTMQYRNGFFPTVPNPIQNRAILLRSSLNQSVIQINEKVTPRDIRIGKYDERIEIDLSKTIEEVVVSSPSKDEPYLFDVTITVEIWVTDPMSFYLKQGSDVTEYLRLKLLPSIRSITKGASIIYYNDIDNTLLSTLSTDTFISHDIGISYKIIGILCIPDASAKEYINSITSSKLLEETEKQRIQTTTNIEKFTAMKAGELTGIDMEIAIFKEVAEGKITTEEALEKLAESKQKTGMRELGNIDALSDLLVKLNKRDQITDEEAARVVRKGLKLPKTKGRIPKHASSTQSNFDEADDWNEENEDKEN